MKKELIDHRAVRTAISLGGTNGPFTLGATRRYGFEARTVDVRGDEAVVEAVYDSERLFLVNYRGLTLTYDYGGNLVNLAMDVAQAYEMMPSSMFDQLELDTANVAELMIAYGSNLVLEVNLKGGLEGGDLGGWVNVSADYVVSQGSGRPISIDGKPQIRQVAVGGDDGEMIGVIYLSTVLEQGLLTVGVGDGHIFATVGLRRLVDPEKVRLAKSPAGMINLLSSLVKPENLDE